MTAPVDYSRPVGWWCPVCFGVDRSGEAVPWCRYRRLDVRCMASLVPVYLPIPEGQRPLVDDEVEEAEVVTAQDFGSNLGAGYCVMADISAHIAEPFHGGAEFFWAREFYWPTTGATPTEHINRIAKASARARIVTGATE